MVVFVCMSEGDDHRMSAGTTLCGNDTFVHRSSKIMRKVDVVAT